MNESSELSINRRVALLGFFGGLTSLVSCTTPTPQRPDGFSDQLLLDLKRLEARTYSDEGVAVFLACENLAATSSSESSRPARSLNATLVADFHRLTQALPRVRSDLSGADVPKLVEVLAERNFGFLTGNNYP